MCPALVSKQHLTIFTLQKLSLDICAIRLDYVKFVTRGPDVDTSPYTVCSHDTVGVPYTD